MCAQAFKSTKKHIIYLFRQGRLEDFQSQIYDLPVFPTQPAATNNGINIKIQPDTSAFNVLGKPCFTKILK